MKSKEQAALEYDKNAVKTIHSEFRAFLVGIEFAEHWISVNDELPEKNQKVIVMLNNNDWNVDTYTCYWFTFGDKVKFWRPINRK